MKILVTGANGFIGSYISHFLLRKGYEVFATARNFDTSTRELLSGAFFLPLDVLDRKQLEDISVSADCVIHTATANDIVSKDTLAGIELSAIGTKNVLEMALRNKIGKCIIFSTLQVYGTELEGEISEGSPLHFQNDYGLNHIYAELLGEQFSRQKKVQCVSVRPSNVYGRLLTEAFNRWSLVPGCFCKEVMASGTITIKSSGKQMRNFVNLENISRALEAIILHFPNRYENYNLASSRGFTMEEMAQVVKKVAEKEFNKEVTINITGEKPATTNFFNVSLDKLKAIGFTEDEDYTPETEIREILNFLNAKMNYESN